MSQIKILDLDNEQALSELSSEDINLVRGGFVAAFAATRNLWYARAIYTYYLIRTGKKWLARAASLST